MQLNSRVPAAVTQGDYLVALKASRQTRSITTGGVKLTPPPAAPSHARGSSLQASTALSSAPQQGTPNKVDT